MKLLTEFKSEQEYWNNVHTTCVINVMCALLNKPMENYSDAVKEAVKIADEVVKQLKKKKP